MIKGTSIKLLTFSDGNVLEETVSDVLIGEKTGNASNELTDGRLLGFTLAIPKGDMHEWTDRMVEFWGYRFRTLGFPEQGIEENIPLRWHKKVKVELADTSGVCTVIDVKTYTRHVYPFVCIRDARGGIITAQDGSKVAGVLRVQIYAPTLPQEYYIPCTGDIIIPCECSTEIDTTSEQTVSASIKALREEYPNYAAVGSIGRQYYGFKPDIVIEAR